MKPLTINTPARQESTPLRPYQAWLVALAVTAILAVCLYQLWLAWPTLVVKTAHWQREVNSQLADLLYDAKENTLIAGSYLIGFSFLYGMLHSLGPGHGKVIVTTYLATHPTKVKASLVITVVSAMLQAIVAITLVTVLVWGFNASMRVVNQQASLFVTFSFGLVALFGGLIMYKALKNIYKSIRKPRIRVNSVTPLATPFSGKLAPIGNSSLSDPHSSFTQSAHQHSNTCGCGHNHVADADAINQASTWREYLAIISTIGIRPCTGAIMVLLFANVAGLYWMGVLSAILMAAGTALTTSMIAMMTLTGKHVVKRYLVKANRKSKGWSVTGAYIQLIGGILLIVLGVLLMAGENYGMSPVFSV
ncbi:nickel/cobalt transporter [Vibrio coralliilyticus]|uniref:nickel/cobalt transporter n=1 Tax=Vibrio coralliilyticus TaxID=190893 RepID=UPI000AC4044E|nr:nickel/cobalt transporter [Vibrio coralliilyticus]